MKTKIIQNIKVLGLSLILVSGISYVYAWTAAPANPPNNNVAAPINVGSTQQDKLGSLRINTSITSPATYGLDVWGITRLYGGLNIPTGASSGKVLTSDVSGNATWQTVAVGGSSGITSLTAGSGITLSPTTITTTGTISANTSVLQKRISTACGANQAIKSIDVNGEPTCVNIPSTIPCTYGNKTYSNGAICFTTPTVPIGGRCAFLKCAGGGVGEGNWWSGDTAWPSGGNCGVVCGQ